jgi:uncharacterized protein with NRDE domain
VCLAFLAIQTHPVHSVVLVSNRDEFFWRRSLPAQVWPTAPRLAGGRDQAGGGSWLAVDESGRYALVTNVRTGLTGRAKSDGNHRSRGLLITDYLTSTNSAVERAAVVRETAAQYRPFNLILGDSSQCLYITNWPTPIPVTLESTSTHGLSNGRIDEPWPKVVRGRDLFLSALAEDAAGSSVEPYFSLLSDTKCADQTDLPETGVGRRLEKRLSSTFVRLGVYGTRCSTLLRISPAGTELSSASVKGPP